MILDGLIDAIFPARATTVSDLRNPALWLQEWAGGSSTLSGEQIGPQTALSISAYFAAIRALSEDVAKLPLILYRRLANGGKEREKKNPIYKILHDVPNPEMTSMSFREVVMASALGWGNGYAQIVRANGSDVKGLYPLHPARVTPKRDANGVLFYEYRRDTGEEKPLSAGDVIHIHGLGSDGIVGYSVARIGAESLGLSMAAQTFGAGFFGNGAAPFGVLEHPGKLTDKARDTLRSSWNEKYGGAKNVGRTAIVEEGMKYSAVGIPPEEAQFLETRQFQVEEICRWFRIPPHKIQHLLRSTFSNIEAQNIEYVVDTLLPWLIRWEQEIKKKLFAEDEDVFAEHLVSGLLRGDQAARATYYREQWMIGALSQNEIREFENMNPVDGGDVYYVPLNMKSSDDPDPEPDGSASAPQFPPPAQTPEPDEAAMFLPVFLDAAKRVLRREASAVKRAAKRCSETKESFTLWLSEFYGENAMIVDQAFAPVCDTIARVLGIVIPDTTTVRDTHNRINANHAAALMANGNIETFDAYAERDAEDLAGQYASLFSR